MSNLSTSITIALFFCPRTIPRIGCPDSNFYLELMCSLQYQTIYFSDNCSVLIDTIMLCIAERHIVGRTVSSLAATHSVAFCFARDFSTFLHLLTLISLEPYLRHQRYFLNLYSLCQFWFCVRGI